jgi:hypothetical protein
MEKVFLARGVPLPPWRAASVMNRWLVDTVKDVAIAPRVPAPPPTAAHAHQHQHVRVRDSSDAALCTHQLAMA